MAKTGFVIMVVVLVIGFCFSVSVNGLGGLVGARTKVLNVKYNHEIQDLGRYSVEQYNKQKQTEVKSPNGGLLKFKAVIEAETQVVAGTKYYLKIATFTASGAVKTFDAVVVVQPWRKSKELLNFTPSPSH